MSEAREAILGTVRAALGRGAGARPAVPPSARVPPRSVGDTASEMKQLLAEIDKLGGKTRRIARPDDLRPAIEELVAVEQVRRATMWELPELHNLGSAGILQSLGIALVSPHAPLGELAKCDLGIVSADAALPETGTLLLRSSPERPRMVSLLPRVLLAIVHPGRLRADLHQALAGVKGEGYFVFVTGPSRTADIELTLTIGVHGPGSLHVWCLEEDP